MRVDEVSIGDYVLNGGEAAALVVIEAVVRLLPGVLGNPESLTEESHCDRPDRAAGVPDLHQAAVLARARRPRGAVLRPPRTDRRLASGAGPGADPARAPTAAPRRRDRTPIRGCLGGSEPIAMWRKTPVARVVLRGLIRPAVLGLARGDNLPDPAAAGGAVDGGVEGADGRQRLDHDRLPAGAHVRQPQGLRGPGGLRRLRPPSPRARRAAAARTAVRSWIIRIVLLVSVVAARLLRRSSLWRRAREARGGTKRYYSSKARTGVQRSYASFTLRWGGIVILLFVIYHLLHLTWNVVAARWSIGQPVPAAGQRLPDLVGRARLPGGHDRRRLSTCGTASGAR